MRPPRSRALGAGAGIALGVAGILFPAALGCRPRAAPASGEIGAQVAQALAGGSATFDHSAFDALLRAGVRDGLVDYPWFAARRPALDTYLEAIGRAPIARLERAELMALLINAYNAYTIASILDHPGVASIRDRSGVWDPQAHRVGGFDLTLDKIEHQLLRPYFRDPRIHVAVNCAAVSCAPLPAFAFSGHALEVQLEELTRAFFSNPGYARLDGDRLRLSKLLEWYGDDFIHRDAAPRADSLALFVARYAPAETAERLRAGGVRVEFLDYDWALNHAGQPSP